LTFLFSQACAQTTFQLIDFVQAHHCQDNRDRPGQGQCDPDNRYEYRQLRHKNSLSAIRNQIIRSLTPYKNCGKKQLPRRVQRNKISYCPLCILWQKNFYSSGGKFPPSKRKIALTPFGSKTKMV
jgi:hypothetical protein